MSIWHLVLIWLHSKIKDVEGGKSIEPTLHTVIVHLPHRCFLSSSKLPHMEHKKEDHLAKLGFLDSRVMDTSGLTNMVEYG